MKHRIIVSILGPLIALSLILAMMPSVSATAWTDFCFLPSAIHEEWTESGVAINPSGEGEVRVADGASVTILLSSYKFYGVATNNWTNSDYIVGDIAASYPATYETMFGVSSSWFVNLTNDPHLPAIGDTIVWVKVVTIWASNYAPRFWLGISTNNRTSYAIQSAFYPADAAIGGSINIWNVTALRAWTAADFQDYAIWLYANMEIMPGITYSLDYLGFMIGYVGTGSSGYYSLGDMVIDISGSFGVIGFIGMTICPAYAVMQWRRGGDGRVVRLIMAIAAMVVFFALFLASINA